LDFSDDGRDLDIDDFGRHRLLWPKFRHQQLWLEAGTIAEVEPTMSMKPLLAIFFFFFLTKENWVVVFASIRNNDNVACHLDKERESRG
jgi:hypothetical protein